MFWSLIPTYGLLLSYLIPYCPKYIYYYAADFNKFLLLFELQQWYTQTLPKKKAQYSFYQYLLCIFYMESTVIKIWGIYKNYDQ